MVRFKSSSEVKLKYGSLGVKIKNLTQKDWVKVSKKLGLFVPDGGGNGSHVAVYKSKECPVYDSECLVVTIAKKLFPEIQRDMVKKLVLEGIQSGNYTEEDVWGALGIKVPTKKE